MTQQEFINETKTRILHQHIEIIKNAIIQWGINEFGSSIFHEDPNTSEHEMTWYIAGTYSRHMVFGVVLMWGDVDDDIEIRFINNECDVSEGMVSISPAAVVKGIGVDQYMETRKSLAKIVRESLHKKKKEKEDSKMNNKELISANDLYDLVNTQYRRFLDEDHNNLLGHGITGDIRIERTSGIDDSKAFEEIKIILSKLNPNNCETIHLVKYRTSDHWRCCVDKLDNVFCKIYKDRVDREGYVCELFANPLVQNIITTVEEAIGPKETKEIAKEDDKEFVYKARREATSFERIKEHVMAWIHTYVETHPEEFVKEPSDNSLAQPQITTTTKRHRGEKNTFEIEVVDNKDKIHRLRVVEWVPGASYEIYNTGIYHSHVSININIYEDGFGVNMQIGKIYDDFTREQMESLSKYLNRVIKEDMVAILELEAACKPCQLSNSNNQPMREVLDNSIDECSRISDEMITTSLGIAKVSDYVTNLTNINKEDIYMATDEKKEKYNKIPIKDVQFNSKKKTTTVIFGEKTDPDKKKKNGSEEEDKKSEDIIVVSKCSPKDKFDPEVGLAMCISKAYFGNRSKFEKAVAEWTKVSEARDKKKAEDEKKKKAKQKKNKSTTTTKKKTGTRPGRPRKKSLDKKDKETVIKETEILDNKPNEVKVDDNTDNIIG